MKPAIDPKDTSSPRDEGSAVRERTPSRHPSTPDLSVSREARIEQKIAEAERLLDRDDPRRRMLQVAFMRRDEGLVDAVLSTLRDPPKSR
jgi:hypothetical protein